MSKTVTAARYAGIGAMSWVSVVLAVTGTGTSGTALTVSLPSGHNNTNVNAVLGQGYVYDSSAGTIYRAIALAASATTVRLQRTDSGSLTSIGSDPSFALGNGDIVAFTAMYERAA